MLTTEECERIAKIMFDGGPKNERRVENIVNQLTILPDAIRVNFEQVKGFLRLLLSNVDEGDEVGRW